jgi:filamentous hemagglutinin
LLLVVAWLYSHPPEGANRPEPPRQNGPNAFPVERIGNEQQRATDDRVGKRPTADPIDSDEDLDNAVIARNVRVTNEDGRVIYRGDIDLGPTLARIDQGKRLRFSHDGIVFENREKRLPIKPSGYYHEFVHPTKGESGPGGQRMVLGKDGEIYYSPDHYHSFRRIR